MSVSLAISTQSASAIRPHPLVPGDTPSSDFTVRVNGTAVPVVKWFTNFAYAHLSLEEGITEVNVEVETTHPITHFTISPIRDAVNGAVDGRVLRFPITGRRYLKLSIDGLPTLFIFVDPAETQRMRLGDSGVVDVRDFGADPSGLSVSTDAIQAAINAVSGDPALSTVFFPPGRFRSGTLDLQSNVTLYIDEGALLQASDSRSDFNRDNPGGPYRRLSFISAYNARNVAIRGRGVIDGNGAYLRETFESDDIDRTIVGRPGIVDAERVNNVQFARCENVLIDGVFSRNSSSWNTIPYHCDDTTIRNYKVLGNMLWKNDDGIDPDSCQRLVIRDSIFLSRDDAVVLKTCGTFNGQTISPDGGRRDMVDVLVENNLLWSETAAMKYGFNESEASNVHRITFARNVVLTTREGVQMYTSGPALAHHFTFRENHYEECTNQNYRLVDSSNDSLRFINETHLAFGASDNQIQGTNFRFYNLRIGGRLITDAASGRFVDQPENAAFVANGDLVRTVDNVDPGFSRQGTTWTVSTANSQRFGADYLHDGTPETNPSDTWAQWNSPFAEPTEVDLFLWWAAHSNRPASVPVVVSHSGGTSSLFVDQTRNGGRWNLLGRFTVRPGDWIRVLATASGYTMADAARFCAVNGPDVPVPPEPPGIGNESTHRYPGEDFQLDLSEATGFQLDLVQDAHNGRVSIVGNQITYSPNPGFTGTDDFVVCITDGWESRWARLSVVIDERTIEHWRKRELGGIRQAGDLDDPDGDGFSNLEEYHCGTNPLQVNRAPFAIAIEGSSLVVTLSEAIESPSTVTHLQSSTGAPFAFQDTGETGATETLNATHRVRRFVITRPVNEISRFFRFRIERP